MAPMMGTTLMQQIIDYSNVKSDSDPFLVELRLFAFSNEQNCFVGHIRLQSSLPVARVTLA